MINLYYLLAIIFALATSAVSVVLVWLVRGHLKLKRDYRLLADAIQSHNHDIADLLAAVVAADGHIAATDEQIDILDAKLSAYQHNELSSHPYSLAIQQVRSGASVDELMQNAGLRQDEAALLIRLHGSNKNS